MRVRVARESRPGVADDGDEKYDKHKQVTVVKPGEVVQHPLAEPCFLRQPFHGFSTHTGPLNKAAPKTAHAYVEAPHAQTHGMIQLNMREPEMYSRRNLDNIQRLVLLQLDRCVMKAP